MSGERGKLGVLKVPADIGEETVAEVLTSRECWDVEVFQ